MQLSRIKKINQEGKIKTCQLADWIKEYQYNFGDSS